MTRRTRRRRRRQPASAPPRVALDPPPEALQALRPAHQKPQNRREVGLRPRRRVAQKSPTRKGEGRPRRRPMPPRGQQAPPEAGREEEVAGCCPLPLIGRVGVGSRGTTTGSRQRAAGIRRAALPVLVTTGRGGPGSRRWAARQRPGARVRSAARRARGRVASVAAGPRCGRGRSRAARRSGSFGRAGGRDARGARGGSVRRVGSDRRRARCGGRALARALRPRGAPERRPAAQRAAAAALRPRRRRGLRLGAS